MKTIVFTEIINTGEQSILIYNVDGEQRAFAFNNAKTSKDKAIELVKILVNGDAATKTPTSADDASKTKAVRTVKPTASRSTDASGAKSDK